MVEQIPSKGSVILDIIAVVRVEGTVVVDSKELVLSLLDGKVANVGSDGLQDVVVESGVLVGTRKVEIKGHLNWSDGHHGAVSEEGRHPKALEDAHEGTEPTMSAVLGISVVAHALGVDVDGSRDDVPAHISGDRKAQQRVNDSTSIGSKGRNGVLQLSTAREVAPKPKDVANKAMLRLLRVVLDSEIAENILEIIVSQAIIPEASEGRIGIPIHIRAITAFLDREATLAALLSSSIVQVQILQLLDEGDNRAEIIAALSAKC